MNFRFLHKESILMLTALLIVLFIISFYIFYIQVFYYQFYNIPKSDLSDHIKLIELILQHKYHVPHAGFHYATLLFSNVIHLNREISAIILLSLFVLVSFIVTYHTLKLFLDKIYSEKFLLLISVFLHLVTPVFLPLLNTTIYFGQGSPNIWHSPTFIMTKPFVLIIILFVIQTLKEEKKQSAILLGILTGFLLMVSVYFKPNFALALIPALAVFVLIEYRNKIKKYILSILIVLPSLILLGYQFFSTYFLTDRGLGGTGDEIILTFFGVWKVHSPSVFLSILRGSVFPLLIVFFRRKEIVNNQYLLISWLIYLVAFTEGAFLAEKESFFAFNFSNGYNFSLISLYTFSVIELLKWMKETGFELKISGFRYSVLSGERKNLFITTIIFYWYIASGVIYLIRQILGYGFS